MVVVVVVVVVAVLVVVVVVAVLVAAVMGVAVKLVVMRMTMAITMAVLWQCLWQWLLASFDLQQAVEEAPAAGSGLFSGIKTAIDNANNTGRIQVIQRIFCCLLEAYYYTGLPCLLLSLPCQLSSPWCSLNDVAARLICQHRVGELTRLRHIPVCLVILPLRMFGLLPSAGSADERFAGAGGGATPDPAEQAEHQQQR